MDTARSTETTLPPQARPEKLCGDYCTTTCDTRCFTPDEKLRITQVPALQTYLTTETRLLLLAKADMTSVMVELNTTAGSADSTLLTQAWPGRFRGEYSNATYDARCFTLDEKLQSTKEPALNTQHITSERTTLCSPRIDTQTSSEARGHFKLRGFRWRRAPPLPRCCPLPTCRPRTTP